MPNTAIAPVSKKSAYQRPYKSRSERRKKARDKYGESHDFTFIKRVAAGIGIVLLLVVGFAVKGYMEREKAAPVDGSNPEALF